MPLSNFKYFSKNKLQETRYCVKIYGCCLNSQIMDIGYALEIQAKEMNV